MFDGCNAEGKNGPATSEFRTDAQDCIMVRVSWPTEYKVVVRRTSRRERRAPLDSVIPTTTSVPACSGPSRCGLTATELGERLERRPILTAPARASSSRPVGRDEETGFQIEPRNWESSEASREIGA